MSLRFLSFNIRTAKASSGPPWAERREHVVRLIAETEPDVAGLQEATGRQLLDLAAALPRYRPLGRARGRLGRGEHCPLLVDEDAFDILEGGDFWLSERPSRPGSRGWDASAPRICTWAALRARATGVRFVVFNTHLDQAGPTARERGAVLLAARAAGHARHPRVLLGDLNADPDSAPLRLLAEAGFRDTYRERHPDGADGTFHRFTGKADGPRIDYVLCDERWSVVEARVLRSAPEASDHFPVLGVLAPR